MTVIPMDDHRGPHWMAALHRSEKGALLAVPANGVTILTHDAAWRDVLAFDELRQAIITTKPPKWYVDDAPENVEAGEWTDADTVRLQNWFLRRHELRLGREAVWDCVIVAAQRNRVHPVRGYLDGLVWDGAHRVDTWTHRFLGAEPGVYSMMVGRWVLLSAVARIYEPGCKVDTMCVLEGRQGLRKSTALRVLAGPEFFSDTPLDLRDKDRFLGMRGAWIVEMAELDSMRGADVNRIKSFLSSPVDTFRPPYGRTPVRVPRSSIFVGTTNADTYLGDATGARRFWPLACTKIDVEGLATARDQLWAEAVSRYREDEKWWPEGDIINALCADEQEARAEGDPWESVVSRHLAKPGVQEVTMDELLADVVGKPKTEWTRADETRIGGIVRRCGWHGRRERRDGARVQVYRPRGGQP